MNFPPSHTCGLRKTLPCSHKACIPPTNETHTNTPNPQRSPLKQEESTPARIWWGTVPQGGCQSREHIKRHTWRGWGQFKDWKERKAEEGKEKQASWKLESGMEREKRSTKERREERVERFGCDESEHCDWSHTGWKVSRERKKKQKVKRWYTAGPTPGTYLYWEAQCVGKRFWNIPMDQSNPQFIWWCERRRTWHTFTKAQTHLTRSLVQ